MLQVGDLSETSIGSNNKGESFMEPIVAIVQPRTEKSKCIQNSPTANYWSANRIGLQTV